MHQPVVTMILDSLVMVVWGPNVTLVLPDGQSFTLRVNQLLALAREEQMGRGVRYVDEDGTDHHLGKGPIRHEEKANDQ